MKRLGDPLDHQVKKVASMANPTKPTKPVRMSAFNPIKHGAFSNVGLLPGEDPGEFLQLVLELYKEYKPSGPTEKAEVYELAKLLWRRERLGVYERARVARNTWGPRIKGKDEFGVSLAVFEESINDAKEASLPVLNKKDLQALVGLNKKDAQALFKLQKEHAENIAKFKAADQTWRKEASKFFDMDELDAVADELTREMHADVLLAQLGDMVTTDSLIKDLDLRARLDARIDRVIKRIMQLKAMKPMVGLGPAAPTKPRRLSQGETIEPTPPSATQESWATLQSLASVRQEPEDRLVSVQSMPPCGSAPPIAPVSAT